MCCRVIVSPCPGRGIIEEGLRIAGFVRNEQYANFWARIIEEEKTTVRARLTENGLEFSLYPSVTSWEGHAGKRLAAGLMFQTAALFAEKVGAVVSQHATVTGCFDSRGSVFPVGHYPKFPMRYEYICPGFQLVLVPNGADVTEASFPGREQAPQRLTLPEQ